MIVGTVKKSMAALASRWLRRKVSQRLARSGSLSALSSSNERWFSRKAQNRVCGVPHGSAALPRLGCSNDHPEDQFPQPSSASVSFRPALRILEINLQYIRKPARCQRVTVSGVTTMRAFFHPDQTRRVITQKAYRRGRRLAEDVDASARRVVDAKRNSREGEFAAREKAAQHYEQSPTKLNMVKDL